MSRCTLVALAVLTAPALAWAEPTTADRALATVLYEEGRALLAAGKAVEACPRFERAQKLDPSGGTLLNLALCHEQEGKSASAWAEFNEALAVAVKDGRKDRAAAAEEHLAALRPKLARLRVSLASRTPGARVSIDGRELPDEALGVGVPVDPGAHHVEASAPGFAPYRVVVEATQPGDRAVAIPALDALPGEGAEPPRPAAPAPRTGRTSGRTLVIGGVVVVTAGLAAGAAALSKSARRDALAACPEKAACSADSLDRNRTALHFADAATALVLGSAAAAGVLVWSVLDDRAQVGATAAPGGVGVRATIRF
jgi:tetratricopeptide (TPR) repeat protein